MAQEWKKIEFFKERPFGKRMGAALLFFRENAGTILRLSAGFLLPIILFFALFFTWSTSHLYKMFEVGYFTPSSLAAFTLCLASVILLMLLIPSFSFALLQLYNKRENRLKGIQFGEVMQAMKPNFIRMARVLPFLIVFAFLLFLLKVKVSLAVASLVFVVTFLGIGVPLLLFIPIYLIEGKSMWTALKQTFHFGYKYWMSIFIFRLVLGVLAFLVALFFAFPWIVTTYVELAFFSSAVTFEIPFVYSLLFYLFSVLMAFGLMLSSSFIFIGMSYQYAHVSSYKGTVFIVDDIEKAEQSFKILHED